MSVSVSVCKGMDVEQVYLWVYSLAHLIDGRKGMREQQTGLDTHIFY